MADGPGHHLNRLKLADYRRRTADIYAEVRRLGVGPKAHAFWCRARDDLFRTHPSSALPEPTRTSFRGLPYWPYDPALHVVGEIENDDLPTEERIVHSGPGQSPVVRVGRVGFDLLGATRHLDLFWFDDYGGGLFLPFRDGTSGTTTYAGGRYLLDGAKAADLGQRDGLQILDFNFAYHPSCVHDPRWSCPLAPAENRLDVDVAGGERLLTT